MHSKQLVSLNKSLLQILKNAGLNDLYNCGDTCLLKILSISERKLFDGDYRDLIYNPHPVKCSFRKKIAIIVSVFFKTLILLGVFVLLNLRCRLINYKNKTTLRSKLNDDQIFFADTARSFEGFQELAKVLPASSVICIFHPYHFLNLLHPLPKDKIYYTTGTRLNFSTIYNLFKFIFYSIPKVIGQNSVINAIETPKITDFFVYFSKNLMFKEFNKQLQKNINHKATVFVRCDASYACLTDAMNSINVDTIHFIHGVHFKEDITIIPVLAKYVFCSGERGVNDFKNDLDLRFVFNISAPLQVIMKPAHTDKKPEILYDVVIIASFDMYWNHISYCELFQYFKTANLKVLLRHHPDVQPAQKQLIEDAIGTFDLSVGNLLIEDILKGDKILCSSEDSLLHCLLHFKKVIFYPVTDKDRYYFCESFMNVLPNLLLVDNKNEMQARIDELNNLNISEYNHPEDYFEKTEYLFGTYDQSKMIQNFRNAVEAVKRNRA